MAARHDRDVLLTTLFIANRCSLAAGRKLGRPERVSGGKVDRAETVSVIALTKISPLAVVSAPPLLGVPIRNGR